MYDSWFPVQTMVFICNSEDDRKSQLLFCTREGNLHHGATRKPTFFFSASQGYEETGIDCRGGFLPWIALPTPFPTDATPKNKPLPTGNTPSADPVMTDSVSVFKDTGTIEGNTVFYSIGDHGTWYDSLTDTQHSYLLQTSSIWYMSPS